MVDFDVIADDGRFADNDASAVIDEECTADFGAGVNVYASDGVYELGHHARDHGYAQYV